MRLKVQVTTAVIILLLPIAVWVFSREALRQSETPLEVRQEQLVEKLGIEPVKKTLAPDFFLKDLNGNSVRLRDLRGKVVLLNFWATWCPSCRFEMPSMEALYKEYSRRGLVVLAVNFRESRGEIRPFYKEHNLSFPALLDPGGETFARYETWSLPTTFLIDKRGQIVGKVIGYRDWRSDQSKIFFTQLLKEAA
jgi:peroxiredoxin